VIRFAVVTKTSEQDMALNLDVFIQTEQPRPENNYTAQHKRLANLLSDPNMVMALRAPVWYLGEIVILGPDGREMDGPERKPDKWYVDVEVFTDLEEAIARSREVREP
jgi:hypothetical protein